MYQDDSKAVHKCNAHRLARRLLFVFFGAGCPNVPTPTTFACPPVHNNCFIRRNDSRQTRSVSFAVAQELSASCNTG